MASSLPSSLSPHICILSSPDLVDLLKTSGLPPLHHVLQSFSPLPQVTTRTTSLTSIQHPAFALRFSDLQEIEQDSFEDEERRAARTLDWIGERISRRCAKWVEDVENLASSSSGDPDAHEVARTPWWAEVKRCAEGDHIPGRSEGWNHPISAIFAVSTTVPNPLQAITALHSRPFNFPPWVDVASIMRYTLIIHPNDSSLTDEEANALLNAAKKQYGLHCYLLSVALPTPPPSPVPVPGLIPRLPPIPLQDSPRNSLIALPEASQPASPIAEHGPNTINTIRMCEDDIQRTAKFTREFVVMSLVPWMEKCVMEWNETYSSSRRLPSRLFSSTRRLFGSQAPTPTATPAPPGASVPVRGHSMSISGQSAGALVPGPSQQRRLAEFATLLGDLKVATAVWESLRKDGKGGSDILPMLLAPSPALQLHASYALSSTGLDASPDPSAVAQLRSLVYAARWDVGISPSEFMSDELGGERWLVWAAGNSDEASSAILLAQAALLSARKRTRRKASFWYFSAAVRLEKYGIKPLTMHFLRKALRLYENRSEKELSPLFWESQNISQSSVEGFDAILSGIEHPLGRLLYTTGDAAGALQYFLGLLKGNSIGKAVSWQEPPANDGQPSQTLVSSNDKVYLDDFRDAFTHFLSKQSGNIPSRLKLPFSFCNVRKSKIRVPHARPADQAALWEEREETWKNFLKSTKRKETLDGQGHARTGETFWVELQLRNPLNAEVTLTDLTVVVEEETPTPGRSTDVEVEVIDELVLEAMETRTVPISILPLKACSLVIKQLSYRFLSLLPADESLSCRGRRLNKTPAHWRQPTYEPDTLIKVQVKEAGVRLEAAFVDDSRLILAQNETKVLSLWFSNTGARPIEEIWIVKGGEDNIWIPDDDEGSPESSESSSSALEVISSTNSLVSDPPRRLSFSEPLAPGASQEIQIWLHAESTGEQQLSLLLIYREAQNGTYSSTCVSRSLEVSSFFNVSVTSRPSQKLDSSFLINLNLENSYYSDVEITQVTTVSPSLVCTPLVSSSATLPSAQSLKVYLSATQWSEASNLDELQKYVARQLHGVLSGQTPKQEDPPPVDLVCCHDSARPQSFKSQRLDHALRSGRRRKIADSLKATYPHIPSSTHSSIFPLYHPHALDLVVFWRIPDQGREGHLLVTGLNIGIGHGSLDSILETATNMKATRNMYAETAREKAEIMDAIRASEWNVEMNPLVITTDAPSRVEHDFRTGPCVVAITFNIRNFSQALPSRFKLVLEQGTETDSPSQTLPAPYHGRLTFRGVVTPSSLHSSKATLWVTRPGVYAIDNWRLLTEVLESDAPPTRCYSQLPDTDRMSFVVVAAKE